MDSLDEFQQAIENDKVDAKLDKGLSRLINMPTEKFRDKFDLDFIDAIRVLDEEHKRSRIEKDKRRSASN